MHQIPMKMHRRNRNIILFFEENENVRSITSKMVRLYMNRFIIDEEQRFEITGIFNLAKVSKVTVERGERRRLWKLSRRNWNDDRKLIKDAFKKLEFLTLFNTDVFIFMGTSLYLDRFNSENSLNELMRNLGRKCSSTTSISMTLLSGENHELHTKNDVQKMYRGRMRLYQRELFNLFGKSFWYNFDRTQSLSDDLENLFSHIASPNYFYSQIIIPKTRWHERKLKQEVRNLFLYEMLSEDDIKSRPDLIRRSDDYQYLLSLCRVITVHLK